ncbi:hypothetical protein AMS68_000533 [Peltaster fructicola]|uniref:Zinc transporter n=1 Tax=Peltaster fructicola TaxID=286661 RepID=A0A6H0XJX4_9PEZI|nr:hypothetical protein AMS68_000533 [Peltaster fructicola]
MTGSHAHHHEHAHSSEASSAIHSTPYDDADNAEDSSTIKIDHDYDFQHNLNQLHTGELTIPNNASASLLSPAGTTFSIAESPSSDEVWTPKSPQITDSAFLSIDPAAGAQRNPFNFTPQQYDATTRASLGRSSQENLPGKRRGHKYRHSSIHTAHQIFQAPTQRAPLTVPASLPIPTHKEAWRSLSRSQNIRLAWCLTHFVVAGVIQLAASGSLALTALSRLIFFDAAGAVSCVAVDVMTNFEVWTRSTIKHPFGLGRADVLAGFGMAVFIAFMGLDIISHGTQHALENLGDHEAHSPHSHERPSTIAVLLAATGAALTTLISAIGLGNHMRVGRTIQVPWLARWGNTLGNPSHFLTLSCCAALPVLTLLNTHAYSIADPLFAFIIAGCMIAFGVRLGSRLGNILLMAYTDPTDKNAISQLVLDIESDTSISAVEEAKIWQVHYGLGLADLKIKCRAGGQADDATKLRKRIMSLVKSRLGGAYGEGRGPRWDISIQVTREKD